MGHQDSNGYQGDMTYWEETADWCALNRAELLGANQMLVQERRYSIANALELCLSCTNSSKCLWMGMTFQVAPDTFSMRGDVKLHQPI